MTRTERMLADVVPGPVDQVRDFYVDLDNIRLVHPLVASLRSTSRSETAEGYLQTWRVRDRIPLGPFILRTSYTARLTVPVGGDVIADARQFPRVRLHSTVSFQPIGGGTRIVERLQIDAPRPLAAVTVREAVKAHSVMLAGIRGCFAT